MTHVVGPFKGKEGVNTEALDRSANKDSALRYVTYRMFERLFLLNLNFNLHLEGGKLWELIHYVQERGQLLQMFQNLADSVVVAFKVIRPSLARPKTVETDKDGMTVNQTLY